jgi:branched-chain amino acid transport system substrate-binding protein
VHWTYDTVALANGTGSAVVKAGGDTWFFITADYAFGHALERDTAAIVKENGGKVLGQVRAPLNTSDFSSYLLQAQASGAKIIGLANAGGDTWFFITVDYAFGHALERDTANVVKENGGKVLGQVRHPLNTSDFSSYLLQAQASGAKVIGLANAGGDTINTIKQAAEFGIVRGGQKLAGLLIFLTDVHSLGLKTANGLQLTSAFYWDQDDEARAFSKRFSEKVGRPPTMVQAGDYSAVKHWLEAVKAVDTLEGPSVMKQLKSQPINDFMTKNGHIKEDGTLVRDMYLFEVKKPEESKGEWDLYKLVRTIPGEEAFKRPGGNACPLVKG